MWSSSGAPGSLEDLRSSRPVEGGRNSKGARWDVKRLEAPHREVAVEAWEGSLEVEKDDCWGVGWELHRRRPRGRRWRHLASTSSAARHRRRRGVGSLQAAASCVVAGDVMGLGELRAARGRRPVGRMAVRRRRSRVGRQGRSRCARRARHLGCAARVWVRERPASALASSRASGTDHALALGGGSLGFVG